MNSRDQRLYHYEYRRPRAYNPTYNSNNLFDSLNMFIRTDLPPAMGRSSERYSLPRDRISLNNSEIIDYRQNSRPLQNYSTISNQTEARRQTPMLTDKDQHYLRQLQEKQGLRGSQQGIRGGQQGYSRIRQNPQHHEYGQPQINYKLEDSLSREMQEHHSPRR